MYYKMMLKKNKVKNASVFFSKLVHTVNVQEVRYTIILD